MNLISFLFKNPIIINLFFMVYAFILVILQRLPSQFRIGQWVRKNTDQIFWCGIIMPWTLTLAIVLILGNK